MTSGAGTVSRARGERETPSRGASDAAISRGRAAPTRSRSGTVCGTTAASGTPAGTVGMAAAAAASSTCGATTRAASVSVGARIDTGVALENLGAASPSVISGRTVTPAGESVAAIPAGGTNGAAAGPNAEGTSGTGSVAGAMDVAILAAGTEAETRAAGVSTARTGGGFAIAATATPSGFWGCAREATRVPDVSGDISREADETASPAFATSRASACGTATTARSSRDSRRGDDRCSRVSGATETRSAHPKTT